MIRIEDADSFFETVEQHVRSIEEFSTPHPLSTVAAVASLKRYLPEPRYRIQFFDLVDKTVARVVEATSSEKFAVQGGPDADRESITARVRSYEAVVLDLVGDGKQWGAFGRKKRTIRSGKGRCRAWVQ